MPLFLIWGVGIPFPAHLLVTGTPNQVEELFVESLLTKTQLLKERFSKEQIIIGRNEDYKLITEKGF